MLDLFILPINNIFFWIELRHPIPQIPLRFLFVTWPPFCEVCTNHEVEMFQHRTGTSTELGSVAIVNLISNLSCPTCFNRFLDLCPPPPRNTPTASPSVTIRRHSTLSVETSSPPELARAQSVRPPGCHPTRWPPPLVTKSTSLAVLNLLPRSLPYPRVPCRVNVIYVYLVCYPLLLCPRPEPWSLSSPRGFPFRGSLPPYAFLRHPHVSPPPFRY